MGKDDPIYIPRPKRENGSRDKRTKNDNQLLQVGAWKDQRESLIDRIGNTFMAERIKVLDNEIGDVRDPRRKRFKEGVLRWYITALEIISAKGLDDIPDHIRRMMETFELEKVMMKYGSMEERPGQPTDFFRARTSYGKKPILENTEVKRYVPEDLNEY